jgi:CRP-like cAMP-binding protein
MAKSTRPLTTVRPQKVPMSDRDGNGVKNEILLALAGPEREALLAQLEFVRLKPGQLLHEVGDTMRSAFFVNNGLISILCLFPDGKSVEVGLIGSEGFVGLPLIAGFRRAANRAVVQIEATAFRFDANALAVMIRQSPKLDRQLQKFSQILSMEVTLIAACNGLHEVEERLARWLLMCADRVGTPTLPLTQELLAQMLGTRRASVTVAAGILQRAGMIAYTRGHVRIINRRGLEEATCECYGLIQRQVKMWKEESS